YYFDFLTTYNIGEATVNGNECAGYNCTGAPTTFPINPDSSLPPGAQLPGVFTVYNGSITSMGSYSIIPGSHQQMKSVTMTGTTTGTGAQDVVVLFGVHMASQADWGCSVPGNQNTCHGAANLPGGATGDVDATLAGAGTKKVNVNVNPSPAP